jgi:signal transduction histidine kinase
VWTVLHRGHHADRRHLAAGRHLLGLINDVMDISLIESGEMTLSVEPVSVAATVAEAVALIRPLAAARSISVDESCPDPDLLARADQQRLVTILGATEGEV